MKYKSIGILFLAFCALSMQQEKDPDPKAIIKKSEERIQGKSSKGKMKITVIKPKWSSEMELTTWSLGNDFALTLINNPIKSKGIATLKHKKEVWMWYPQIESLTKLSPSMMNQSWLGTDFSNDDLVNQSSTIEDYTHQMGKDTTIQNRQCWKIILTPKEDAAVVWGKIEMWIDQKDYIQLLTKFFDEDQEIVSKMVGSEIKKLGGIDMPSKLEMIPLDKEGQKTVMVYESIEFNIDIEESFFTPQQMKKLRPE